MRQSYGHWRSLVLLFESPLRHMYIYIYMYIKNENNPKQLIIILNKNKTTMKIIYVCIYIYLCACVYTTCISYITIIDPINSSISRDNRHEYNLDFPFRNTYAGPATKYKRILISPSRYWHIPTRRHVSTQIKRNRHPIRLTSFPIKTASPSIPHYDHHRTQRSRHCWSRGGRNHSYMYQTGPVCIGNSNRNRWIILIEIDQTLSDDLEFTWCKYRIIIQPIMESDDLLHVVLS